jgi:predicted membrane-bound spermidine synthase
MFSTVLIMLCFQISRGYVYTRLAVIIAAFMVALGLTATLAGRKLTAARERPGLSLLQAALICLPLIVVSVFRWVQSPASSHPGALVDLAYVALAALAGVVGASVFTVASASLMRAAPDEVRAGSVAYATDLVGASVAGFMTGFLLIPALGVVNAALAVGFVNFILLGALQVFTRRLP